MIINSKPMALGTKKRINWIDIAKGIAIMLVILGHTVKRGDPVEEDVIRGLIFSFHMPLFIVLSSITTSLSRNEEQFVKRTEKSFRRLIVPAVVVYCLLQAAGAVLYGYGDSLRVFVTNTINSIVFASGVDIKALGIKAMGRLWFLFALFFIRSIYDYLQLRQNKKNSLIWCIILAVIGYAFTKIQWLPCSLDVVLVALPFIPFGQYLKQRVGTEPSVRDLALAALVWVGLFVFIYHKSGHYLELSSREFPLIPLSFLCAAAGIVFVSEISKFIDKVPTVNKIFSYIGRISMEIYLVHALDLLAGNIWNMIENTYVRALIKIIVDISIAFAYTEIKKTLDGKSERKN